MSLYQSCEVLIRDEPNYSCFAYCIGQNLKIKFTWNSRVKKRFVTITGNGDTVYLQNTAIEVGDQLPFNINAEKIGYGCILMLNHIPNMDTTIDYLNWSRNMFMTVMLIT